MIPPETIELKTKKRHNAHVLTILHRTYNIYTIYLLTTRFGLYLARKRSRGLPKQRWVTSQS